MATIDVGWGEMVKSRPDYSTIATDIVYKIADGFPEKHLAWCWGEKKDTRVVSGGEQL